MLIQLIYFSTPVTETSEATKEFIPKAKVYNDEHGISGMILSDASGYIQLLEGQKTEVDALFQKISADPRHMNVRMVRYMDIEAREFPAWSMRHVQVSNLKRLPDHAAIELLYTTADKELSKKTVKTITFSVLATVLLIGGVLGLGPLVESRFFPAVTHVAGNFVQVRDNRAELLITGNRTTRSCDLGGFYVFSPTQKRVLQAYSRVISNTPETDERMIAKLDVFPMAENYRVEIRYACHPLWSQSQVVDVVQSSQTGVIIP